MPIVTTKSGPAPSAHKIVAGELDDCVSSPHNPSECDNNDCCEVHVEVGSTLIVKDGLTESFWDRFTLDGANHCGTVGPETCEAGTIVWTTDSQFVENGWGLYASAHLPFR